MKKKTIRIAGWALCLSMAAAGITSVALGNKGALEASAYGTSDFDASMKKVTTATISSLTTGDKVVIALDGGSKGVTGYSGKDATVGTTSWMEFTVTSVDAANNKYSLKDATSGKWISNAATNAFKIDGDSETFMTAFDDGKLGFADTEATTRYLYQNGTNYRCYSLHNDYVPFYAYILGSGKTVDVTGVSITGLEENAVLDGSSDNNVFINGAIRLSATVSYTQGDDYKDGNNSVSWSSNNESVATVSNGVVTLQGNGQVTITATSMEKDSVSDSLTFTVANINPARGISSNPFTVPEAKDYALSLGPNDADTIDTKDSYVTGIVSYIPDDAFDSGYGQFTFDMSVDGVNDEDNDLTIYYAYYTEPGVEMTQEQASSIHVGDRVTMCGKLENFQGSAYMAENGYFVSHEKETKALTLSKSEETLTLNSPFSYSGTVTTAYTIKSNADVTSSCTYSGYDMSKLGDQTVTVTYTDPILGEVTSSYTLHVVYAPVTQLSLSASSLTLGLGGSYDLDEVNVTINSNANPNYSWSVYSAKDGENADMTVVTDYEYNESTHVLSVKQKAGQIVMRCTAAGDANVYRDFTITITGAASVSLASANINGIVGGSANIGIANIANMTEPYSYAWSIEGDTEVATATTGAASSTVSFTKKGSATIKLVVTDANSKTCEASAAISVIDGLNTVSKTSVVEKIVSFDPASDTSANLTLTKGEVTITTTAGAFNNGTDYRVYKGATFTVSVPEGKTITEIVFTFSNSSNDGGGWATTVNPNASSWSKKTTSGDSGEQARITSLKVTYKASGTITYSNVNYNAQKAVIDFAEDFNSDLESICIAYGQTNANNLSSAWNALDEQYDNWFNQGQKSLTVEEIAIAKGLFANANALDKVADPSADVLQHMLAKYDEILSHYDFSDFLAEDEGTGRTPANAPRILGSMSSLNNDSTAITVIASILGVSVIALVGGFFLAHKKKEN